MKTKIELVHEMVGKGVMTIDPLNNKMEKSKPPHGPYKLLKMTKGGRALLQVKDRIVSIAPRDIVVQGYHDGSNKKSCSCEIY